MLTWLLVWLLATLFTVVALLAFLASMASAIVQLGRAAQRFQREVGGLAADISRSAARAGEHAGRLQTSAPRSRP